MVRTTICRCILTATLLANPVALFAQRDSATPRIVPLWREGQVITRVSGDPNVAGAPYVIRIMNFDNELVPPHTHPEDEHIVVVQGTWFLGAGERFDSTRLRPLAVGDYALVPRREAHFAWSKGMTVIQVHGIGPFRTDWVDSVFVLTSSGGVAQFRDSSRPLTPSEVAAHFRYRLGDTVTVGEAWGIVRAAGALPAIGGVGYLIDRPGLQLRWYSETEVRPRSRRGGP